MKPTIQIARLGTNHIHICPANYPEDGVCILTDTSMECNSYYNIDLSDTSYIIPVSWARLNNILPTTKEWFNNQCLFPCNPTLIIEASISAILNNISLDNSVELIQHEGLYYIMDTNDKGNNPEDAGILLYKIEEV